MNINHIGYAVRNIAESISVFEKLGFCVTKEPMKDLPRKVEIAFMKNNETVIELISPTAKNSPIDNILNKLGCVPYHLCFETNDLDRKVEELKNEGFIIIEKKNKAVALSKKNIVFLYSKIIGLIELVEA